MCGQASASAGDPQEGTSDLTGANVAAAIVAALTIQHSHQPRQPDHPPPAVVVEALCLHAGRHFTTRWYRGARIQYVLWGVHYYFEHTYDDITGVRGETGEGSWSADTGNGYHGGLQFLSSTWARAGGTGDAAQASAAEQIYRAWIIWRSHGGSWSEWGDTRTACGLH